MADSLRQSLEKRLAQLKNERSKGWESQWRELSDYVEPRTGRWQLSQTNEGQRRDQKIINNRARLCLRVLKAGMMSGGTNPARPWLKLGTPDADLMEFGPVKVWLHQAETAMLNVFLRSNLYNVLPSVYGESGLYGTGNMMGMADQKDLVRFYQFTVGSYYLATSSRQQVDTNYREFQMTARQMAQQFGVDAMSAAARSMLDSSSESWIDVCHAIEPNDARHMGMEGNTNMPFRSVYWEKGSDQDKVLRSSGFKTYPGMSPRWEVVGEDTYGTGPGDVAIGDSKGLQLMEKRKFELLEKGARPPMTAPSSLRNQKASILPGDITYVDVSQGMQGFQPTYIPDSTWFSALRGELQEHENRIQEAFFYDLFLMVSQIDRSNITATEIAARQQEKLLMLGPVLERLNDELLDPLVERTFALMLEQSTPRWMGLLPGKPLLPPPPQELGGMDLRIEYDSVFSQAQKAMGITSIERLVGFTGNLAGIAPEALDKLNLDQAIDEYANGLGVSPTIVRSDDEVAQIRQARAQQAMQQQAAEQIGGVIQGAKLLSETDVSSPSALTALYGQ